jgi:Protein of unknown function DUF262/Protein of unknown function (DUF1524)
VRMAKRREQPIDPQSDDFDWLLSIAPFHVPRYQRAFDWDTEEVRDFARDVLVLAQRRVDGGLSRHFFGALISIFHKSEHYYEVVDGQQRLATETICLNELYGRLTTLAHTAKAFSDVHIAKEAGTHARRVRKRLTDDNGPLLVLSRRDSQFFNDLLGDAAAEPKRTDDQSHRRLWSARAIVRSELFDTLLDGVDDLSYYLSCLVSIEQALLEDGYLVHLYTEDRGQAYRLFSVLNDRGRALSDGSLLRTHTLAGLEDFSQQQQGAETDWDMILKIGDSFVNSFLAAYYVSHVGSRAPTGGMFDKFCSRFLGDEINSTQAATKLRRTIGNLRHEADTFSLIRAGNWPFDDPRTNGWDRDRLKRLVVSLRHNLAHPLLLAVARETNETTFRGLVLILEPFVFRYINVTNASAARLAAVYYEHAAGVRNTGSLDKNTLRKTLQKLIKTHAPDDVFAPLLRDQLRYAQNSQRRQLIKHFLTTIDDYEDWFQKGAIGKRKVNTKASVYDLDQVNIEHIYPQNPKQPDAQLDEVKHALGNLTPLDDRDGVLAGNEPFTKKLPAYRKSRFAITKPLADLQKWDEVAVAARFTFYAERAKKIFVVE